MSTTHKLFLFALVLALVTLPIRAEWECPANHSACSAAINLCCETSACPRDPHSLTCNSENNHAMLDQSSGFSQATKAAPHTLANFAAEFKSAAINQIHDKNLQKCLQDALEIEESLASFLHGLYDDPIDQLAHFSFQISQFVNLETAHNSSACHAVSFEVESLHQLLDNIENKLFLLHSLEDHNELLTDLNTLKLNFFNTAKAYGTLLGSTLQMYLQLTENEPVITQEYIDQLNSQNSWEAELHPRIANINRKQMKQFVSKKSQFSIPSMKRISSSEIQSYTLGALSDTLPKNFRVDQNWPGCESRILQQAKCDGCWAFSACGVLADRLCIASQSAIKVTLSPQYVLDCDSKGGNCGGGSLDAAWWFFGSVGVPVYDCIPFTSSGGEYLPCGAHRLCTNGALKDNYYAIEDVLVEFKGDKDMMKQEMLKNGSIMSGIPLYQDFMTYKSGIYTPSTKNNKLLGDHAIRIVGWGEDNGNEYWVIANSFGEEWGMKGVGYVKVGAVDIEKNALTGFANLEDSPKS